MTGVRTYVQLATAVSRVLSTQLSLVTRADSDTCVVRHDRHTGQSTEARAVSQDTGTVISEDHETTLQRQIQRHYRYSKHRRRSHKAPKTRTCK